LTETADAQSVTEGRGAFLACRISRYKHPKSVEIANVGLRHERAE
jgi:bile acid-coenzyme A ligase